VHACGHDSTWVRIIVLDARTNDPVPDVELTVTSVDGTEYPSVTDSSGVAEVKELPQGAVCVSSGQDATSETNIVAFATLDSPPDSVTELAPGIPVQSVQPSSSGAHRQIRVVLSNPDNKAAAEFVDVNADPSAGRAGQRVLDKTEPFSKEGLATEQDHTIYVASLDCFTFFLRDERGFAVPEAAYEITLSDLSTVQGKLDRKGTGVIWSPPPGPFEIRYLDLDDVQVKSLAGRVRKASADRDLNEIYKVLIYSPEVIKLAVEAYQIYFDDLSGKGMAEDIQNSISDKDQLLYFQTLMSRAGLPTRDPVQFHKIDESGASD